MFRKKLATDSAKVEIHLSNTIGALGGEPIHDAMRYAVQGGKGLRGFLVLESARLHSVPEANAIWPAAAVEAIHAYSLIHDDLPAMDDDDLRRGRQTIHIKWDEATAILAGDALQALAFELIAKTEVCDAQRRTSLISNLAHAAGGQGMVLGQALDIAAETSDAALSLDQITRLQAGKTGALICWAAQAGAVLAGADPEPLRRYATALGLAFQIADDILDIEGEPEKAGKRLGKDKDAGKATFVSLLGLEGAKARARGLIEEASEALAPYGGKAETLQEAARFAIARDS